jgi:hypothetical protein
MRAPAAVVRAVTSLVVSLPPALAPLAVAQGPDTLRALSEYRLTMPVVRKVMQVGREVESGPEGKQVREATMSITNMSIEQIVALNDRFPTLKKAVASSGLSPKEFATAQLSLQWAYRYLATAEMEKAMGRQSAGPPAHVPKENVEFVRSNEAEIARLGGESAR